jgi:PRTRC genetic system protein F
VRMQSHPKLRAQGGGLRTGRSVPASLSIPAFAGISIPRLSPEIPSKYCFATESFTTWAKFALNWYELGYINEGDKGSSNELVNLAVSRWANQYCGSLTHLTFALTMTLEHPQLYSDVEIEDSQPGSMYLHFDLSDLSVYSLEEKMVKLHALHPEFAETVLFWVSNYGQETLNIWTPSSARDTASYIWWWGEVDEKGFRECYEEYYEGNVDEDDMVTPTIWDSVFPEWVRKPKKVMELDDLRKFALSEEDPWVKEIAQCVTVLAEDPQCGLTTTLDWQLEPVYQAAHLRWNEHDTLARLYDDCVERANQYGGEGFTDSFAIECLPQDPDAFSKKVADLSKVLEHISQLDRLVGLIVDPT